MAARKRKAPRPGGGAPVLDGRTRAVALAMVVFAALLVLWGLRRNAPPAASGGAAGAEEGTSGQGGGATFGLDPGMRVSPSSLPSAVASAAPLGPPPVIDAITLEKKEVCAGEENLVTVKAHTVDGTDPFLHTLIDGHMGTSFPVTLWKDDDGNVMGDHTITVFGKNNVATTVKLPQYEVKDCRPTYIAEIRQRVRANTWAAFDFQARVVGVMPAVTEQDKQRGAPARQAAKPFTPVSYTWTFGDGDTATTLTPVVDHDYEGRTQDTLYSYYVIGVSARGPKGETATGRITLALINPAFEALAQKGVVALMISLDPRFPELGPDGKVTQKVRIWHTRPAPVTIERAILTKYYVGAAGQTAPQDVGVEALLGSKTIPAGKEGLTTTVTLDPSAEEEIFTKTWALTGTSSEGYPVSGSFSVMLPPPRPGPDAGTTIYDPLLKQKIQLAQKLLDKDTVSDDDLWRLEREGAFKDLKVSPQEAAAAASAAIAAAIKKGPPSQQPTSVARGPASPSSTSQQLAPPNQGTGPVPADSK